MTDKMGPAMEALTPMQRAFVEALFVLGTGKYTAAARMAGHTGTEGSLRVWAHRAAHNPKVVAAIREESDRRCVTLLPVAHKALENIVRDGESKDHFAAVKHVQALAGVSPTQKTEVVVKHDTESLRAEIAAAIDHLRAVAGDRLSDENA